MLKLGMIIVCGVTLAAPAAMAQSWHVTSERDAFDDQPNIRATVAGRGYAMAVRCKSGLLETIFLGGYVGEDDASVRYRFDGGEVHSDVWSTSTSGDGLFADAPGEVARWMAAGSRLAFEYEDFSDTPHQFSIPLAGSGAAIGRVLDACGVPRGDPRAQDGDVWRRAVIDIDSMGRANVKPLQDRLIEAGYEVTSSGRRDLATYRALSDFYSGYWSACRNGAALTSSCRSWISSRRYNEDADYPKEPIQLFIEVMQEGISASEADSSSPDLISNPSWARYPTAEFPDRASSRGIAAGSATLNCGTSTNGLLVGCNIVSEEPAGAGFGQSALAAARRAQLSPRTNESTTPGARVQWTIRFEADPSTDPTPSPGNQDAH